MSKREIKASLKDLFDQRSKGFDEFGRNASIDFHCYQKGQMLFIIYGRVEGRPSLECNEFLANVQMTKLGKYNVLSYSYDSDNTCLCINLDLSRRLHRSDTPKTKLLSLSESSVLEYIPISSYEGMLMKYHRQGNTAAVLEIYERVVGAGLTPTAEMQRARESLSSHFV